MSKGKFIVFEGGDKSGKTTQIDLALDFLRKAGHEVLLTREPGGANSVIAEKIREIILDKNHQEMHARAELLLYLASRAQHVEEVVKPTLAQGKIVLCDRFDGSSFAYQGAARNLNLDEIRPINAWAKDNLEPDLVIYIDISPEQAEARRRDEKHDRLDGEAREFHTKVRQGYLEQAKNNDRWVVIDAIGEIDDIAKNIQTALNKVL